MGYIGNEILLVFLHLIQLIGHVIQGVGEVTHLVVGLDINPVIQISGRIFIGTHCNLAKGQVHGLGKYQKNNKGQAEQDSGCDVKYAQDAVLGLVDFADGKVNQHITVGVVIPCDGCRHAEYVPAEHPIVIPYGIGPVSDGCRVKAVYGGLDPGTAQAVHNHGALAVDHPYLGSQIVGQRPYLGGNLLGIQPFPLIHGAA